MVGNGFGGGRGWLSGLIEGVEEFEFGAVDGGGESEVLEDVGAAAIAEVGVGGAPGKEMGDGADEGGGVFGGGEADGEFAGEDFGDAAGVAGDDGGAAGHGFDHDFAEGFGPVAGDDGEVAGAVERGGVGAVAEEVDDVADAKGEGLLFELGLGLGAVEEGFSGDEEVEAGEVGAEMGEGGEEGFDAFATIESPDVAEDLGVGGDLVGLKKGGAGGGVGGELGGVGAVVDGDDFGGGQAEVDPLLAGVVGDGEEAIDAAEGGLIDGVKVLGGWEAEVAGEGGMGEGGEEGGEGEVVDLVGVEEGVGGGEDVAAEAMEVGDAPAKGREEGLAGEGEAGDGEDLLAECGVAIAQVAFRTMKQGDGMAGVDEAVAHVKEAEFLATALGGWVFFEGDDVHTLALWNGKRRRWAGFDA